MQVADPRCAANLANRPFKVRMRVRFPLALPNLSAVEPSWRGADIYLGSSLRCGFAAGGCGALASAGRGSSLPVRRDFARLAAITQGSHPLVRPRLREIHPRSRANAGEGPAPSKEENESKLGLRRLTAAAFFPGVTQLTASCNRTEGGNRTWPA